MEKWKLGLAVIIIGVLCVTGWIKNIVKLTDCDFESPYKCEVVHIAGIIPPVGVIVGWIDTESK